MLQRGFSCRIAVLPSLFLVLPTLFAMTSSAARSEPAPLKILFLGDNGHHRPADRAAQLIPVMQNRGIEIKYVDSREVLSPETLQSFDGLLLYSNIAELTPEQESALLNYVASGKGFIGLHCATACFLNSDRFVELVGGQFKTHGAEVFRTEVADTGHPVLDGYSGFTSWDETYVHHRHNDDRIVLEYRRQGMQTDGNTREPWTWVRTHGNGRVFYTAWGHDHRTWSQPGYWNLVERGIRWACRRDLSVVAEYSERDVFKIPEMTSMPDALKQFGYIDVGPKIPNYLRSAQWGNQEKPLSTMQKPLSAEESIRHFVTPAGFEMKLFAADPDLGGKPIAMNWDERGRLWVCETYDYPNELQPLGQGRDRIRICEDTDGDGAADRFVVFAENLSIPSTLVHYRGGVIVQDGIETLYLKDTDGDDVADMRKTLITGWNMRDTHGGVSNFQYGHDNWFWAMQGYNNSAPVVQGEPVQSFRMGFFRFRLDDADPPLVTDLEFMRSTNNNTWGLGFSEEGIVFGSTANANPSIYMPIPNRYYERVRGWAPEILSSMADSYLFRPVTDKVRQVDQHGGYTAAAGHALYTARRYPATWWNRTAFVCGPTGHLVGTFVISRVGADMQATSPVNLIASDDEWTAPIMAEVGPDGNVWVIDWYNYIVQHNPTPIGFKTGSGNAYVNDLRDRKHGRIYRVTWTGDSSSGNTAMPDLSQATPKQLVAALSHPTMLWRKHAQRLIVERGQQDVVPALLSAASDHRVDEIGLNAGGIHALWTLHGLGATQQPAADVAGVLLEAVQHPSAGVRRAAIQVAPAIPKTATDITNLGLLNDPDAQVRLAALLKISDVTAATDAPDAAVARHLAGLTADPSTVSDRWLGDALTSAAAMHELTFLHAVAAYKSLPQQPPNSSQTPICTVVTEHISRNEPSSQTIGELMRILTSASDQTAQQILAGLAAGWPTDSTASISAAGEKQLLSLIERLPVVSQGNLIRLAMLWGSTALNSHGDRIAARLLATVADDSKTFTNRIDSARQMILFQPTSDTAVTQLLDQLSPQISSDLAGGLIGVLVDSRAPGLAESLISRTTGMTPFMKSAAFQVLTARDNTLVALLNALETDSLEVSDIALDQRQSLASYPNPVLRARATSLLRRREGLPNADREQVLKSLEHVADSVGDAVHGKEVFKKHCAACHTHNGEGTRIGPDLTGMAVHPARELLTRILAPSRSVESNFRQYTVLTSGGLTYSGMLATETKTTIELIDTQAKRHTISRDEISELASSRKSLMPEGFEKQLSETDFSNLLAFLTHRGRYLPLPIDQATTAVTTQGMYLGAQSVIDRLVLKDWNSRQVGDVPFTLIDPQGTRVANAVVLYTRHTDAAKKYPQTVTVPCNSPVHRLHLLSGIGGFAWPREPKGTVTMVLTLHYADGDTEHHELFNGQHFADFMSRAEVPDSEFAFMTDNGRQVRHFSIEPARDAVVKQIELVKGPDNTSPVVLAITAERP